MATQFQFRDSMGFAWVLSNLSWDVFGSMTFASGKDRSPRRAYSHVWAHLHEASRICRVPYSHLLFAVRGELGEIGHQFHFHYLIGGTKTSNVLTFCHQLERAWIVRTGARARDVRPYDRSLTGPEYVAKCLGANAYEISKFDLANEVTLSRSVYRVSRSIARFRGDTAVSAAEKMGDRRGLHEGRDQREQQTSGLNQSAVCRGATVQPAPNMDNVQAINVIYDNESQENIIIATRTINEVCPGITSKHS